jgi:hypothetical protein
MIERLEAVNIDIDSHVLNTEAALRRLRTRFAPKGYYWAVCSHYRCLELVCQRFVPSRTVRTLVMRYNLNNA